jgi:choline-glycine betaine transporter
MEWKKLVQPKVLVAVGVVLVAVRLIAPNAWAGVGALALVAACPLAMVVMMMAMGGMGGRKQDANGAVVDAGARERELAELRADLEALQRERSAQARETNEPPDAGGAGATPAR